MKIFVLGDSHADFSFRLFKARKIYKNSLSIYDFVVNDYYLFEPEIVNLFCDYQKGMEINPSRTLIIFCLGEVDVRCLIHKQIVEKNRDEDEVINDLAIKYKTFLDFISKGIDPKYHKHIWAMSIVPTTEEQDLGHEFSQKGSLLERKRYTEKLNNAIKNTCNQYHFFDIYDLYLGPNGSINKELSNGGDSHIHNNTLLMDKLKKDLSEILGAKFGIKTIYL